MIDVLAATCFGTVVTKFVVERLGAETTEQRLGQCAIVSIAMVIGWVGFQVVSIYLM